MERRETKTAYLEVKSEVDEEKRGKRGAAAFLCTAEWRCSCFLTDWPAWSSVLGRGMLHIGMEETRNRSRRTAQRDTQYEQ